MCNVLWLQIENFYPKHTLSMSGHKFQSICKPQNHLEVEGVISWLISFRHMFDVGSVPTKAFICPCTKPKSSQSSSNSWFKYYSGSFYDAFHRSLTEFCCVCILCLRCVKLWAMWRQCILLQHGAESMQGRNMGPFKLQSRVWNLLKTFHVQETRTIWIRSLSRLALPLIYPISLQCFDSQTCYGVCKP